MLLDRDELPHIDSGIRVKSCTVDHPEPGKAHAAESTGMARGTDDVYLHLSEFEHLSPPVFSAQSPRGEPPFVVVLGRIVALLGRRIGDPFLPIRLLDTNDPGDFPPVAQEGASLSLMRIRDSSKR
jgi:hypothetical protein